MNDPIINAPISKIVEAIKNEIPDHEENRFNGVQVYGIPMYNIETITEALASLGGEEVNYSDVKINLERMVGSVHEWSDNSHEVIADGEVYKITTANLYNALYPFAKELASHPTEREVLEEDVSKFLAWWCVNDVLCEGMSFQQISRRYLAEKHKIEQLYCHHNGKYTLKEDGTCCKCHLPRAEKQSKTEKK